MLKLKLQYFGHLMRRANSLENTLMLGKIKGRILDAWGWYTGTTQRDGMREENGKTEDEMVGWHRQLYRHEFE